MLLTGVMRISQRNFFCGTLIAFYCFSSCRIGETSDSFFLLMIDTLFLYVLVHAKGWGAANHLAVREKILSEEE